MHIIIICRFILPWHHFNILFVYFLIVRCLQFNNTFCFYPQEPMVDVPLPTLSVILLLLLYGLIFLSVRNNILIPMTPERRRLRQ